MPTITVSDDIYQKLTRQAAALQMTVDAIAMPVLEELATKLEPVTDQTPAKRPEDLTFDEWKALFDEHMRIVDERVYRYPRGHVTDISRESIYEGCGL